MKRSTILSPFATCSLALFAALLTLSILGTIAPAQAASLGAPAIASHDNEESSEASVAVYRLANPYTHEHLYTIAAAERQNLVANGWDFEGTAWYAPQSGSPVYRLYDCYRDDHLYTTDANEVRVLTTVNGWTCDYAGAPVFYSGGDVAIYRLYDEAGGARHLLTGDHNEYNTLPAAGWTQEGIKLYAVDAGVVRRPEDLVFDRIMALQADYPDGTPWSNDNYYESLAGWSQMGEWWAGWGCHAWALKCSDVAFGAKPARLHHDASTIRVGDMVRLDGHHTVMVLSIDGSTITVTEGNVWIDSGDPAIRTIHWGRRVDLATSQIDWIITRWD